MTQATVNPYLRTRVMTASPAQLRLMLFEGAIKFSRQAVDAVGKGEWEAMYNALVRAQKIVLELNSSLDHDQAPELCERLSALYTYLYRRLVDANMERDASPIHEVIDRRPRRPRRPDRPRRPHAPGRRPPLLRRRLTPPIRP